MNARVLVVGSGAREHALGRALHAEGCALTFAPGNAGTARLGENVSVRADDVDSVACLAADRAIDLAVIGAEVPLVRGVVDALQARGVPAFGPSRAAAELEGSKVFMKRFLARHRIATAAFEVFDDPRAARAYIRAAGRPLVVKTDGLAAGKGVVVATSEEEALAAVDAAMVARRFGDAGRAIVIEDVLPGQEASFHVLSDGKQYVVLPAAQDHKRVRDGDQGPNTGGMGAYAPAPIVTPEVQARVLAEIVEPTLAGMEKEGNPFRGVLFVGLMIEHDNPRVLEFNVRFGDPEATVLIPMIDGSLYALLDGAARGDLRNVHAGVRSGAALAVVMAAEGYPATPRTGDVIEGLEDASDAQAWVLHAGTEQRDDGQIITRGGRVLTVVSHGDTLDEAARLAYRRVDTIHWRGEHHRRDIGHRALQGSSTA